MGTVLLGNHTVKPSDRTPASWKGAIYSCVKHWCDILTPVFPVQKQAICPEQLHCTTHGTSQHMVLWTFLEGTCLAMVWLLCTDMPDTGRMAPRRAETHGQVTKRKAEGRCCVTACPFTLQVQDKAIQPFGFHYLALSRLGVWKMAAREGAEPPAGSCFSFTICS